MRMEEVARRQRGGCKQEQQHGGGWKVICGTERWRNSCREKCWKNRVLPACIYGLETLGLTERQEEKLQVERKTRF